MIRMVTIRLSSLGITKMDSNDGGGGYGTTGSTQGVKEVGEILMEEGHHMGLVIFEQGKKHVSLVTEGPKGLRYFSLLGGIAMVSCSILGFLFRTGPLNTIYQVYLAIFGCAILTVESKAVSLASFKQFLSEYFRFLYGLYGRALFYIFCCTLLLAQWPFFPDFLCGCYIGFLAFVYISAGLVASKRFKVHEMGKDELTRQFKEHDLNNDGLLCMDEFTALCDSLNLEMDHKQIEAVVLMMDKTNDGLINLPDFIKYFSKAVKADER